MSYSKTIWESLPSENTPINAPRLNKMENGIADANGAIGIANYSSVSTYDLGDYCIYNNKMYECIIPITVGESFNILKWEERNIDMLSKSYILENISIITTQIGDTTVYITKIPFKNNNIKIGLANDSNASFSLENPLDFSFRKNATAVLNGGIWSTTTGYPIGNNLMIDGNDITSTSTNSFYSLGIKDDGTLTTYGPSVTKQAILEDNCHNVIGGYYPILINGEYPSQDILNLMISGNNNHWTTTKYPRSIIAQNANKTIYFLACSGKGVENQSGLTYKECADILLNLDDNIMFGYALDGGGSVFSSYRNMMLNTPIDKEDVTKADGTQIRSINSFLYIKKDIITEHDKDISYLNYALSKVEHLAKNNKLNQGYFTDFHSSFLRILNPDNVNYQGIEVYNNNARTNKLNLESKKVGYYDYTTSKAIVDFNANTERWVFNGKTMANLFQQLDTASLTDLNNATNTGFYFAPSADTVLNKPTSTRAYHVFVLSSSNGTFIHQIALPFTASENIFYRFKRTSGWDAWKQLQFVS